MIIATESYALIAQAYETEIEEIGNNQFLTLKNEYGVIRLRVNLDKIEAYGNGIDNDNDEIAIKKI